MRTRGLCPRGYWVNWCLFVTWRSNFANKCILVENKAKIPLSINTSSLLNWELGFLCEHLLPHGWAGRGEDRLLHRPTGSYRTAWARCRGDGLQGSRVYAGRWFERSEPVFCRPLWDPVKVRLGLWEAHSFSLSKTKGLLPCNPKPVPPTLSETRWRLPCPYSSLSFILNPSLSAFSFPPSLNRS